MYGQAAPQIERALWGSLGTGRFRTRAEQLRYCSGLELVDPSGLVYANDSRLQGEPLPTARCTGSTRATLGASPDGPEWLRRPS